MSEIIDKLFDVSGATAMITGGGTGLGKQFATILAQAGAKVVLCARRVEKLEQAAESIREQGGQASCLPIDVTNLNSVTEAFECCQADSPITVLVNNAGTASSAMLLDLSERDWDRVVDTNLKGAWLVARAAAEQMIRNGDGGSIINIGSVLGMSAQKGTGAYAAAKAGLLHLTRAMALEWATHNIRVNAIAPGYYRTEMAKDYLDSDIGQQMIKRIPQRRLGNPADMNGAILLLASAASDYMTGSVLTIDGGLSTSVI